jgi:hypothetical protein
MERLSVLAIGAPTELTLTLVPHASGSHCCAVCGIFWLSSFSWYSWTTFSIPTCLNPSTGSFIDLGLPLERVSPLRRCEAED